MVANTGSPEHEDVTRSTGTLAPQISIGPVRFYAGGLADAVRTLIECVSSELRETKSRCVSATGAHGVVTARSDRQFAAILDTFWANLPDGVPAVWVGRLKGARDMERCYGPTFFERVVKETADLPVPFFLCGGKPGVAELLASIFKKSLGNSQCVGVYSPPFRALSEEEWVGLGKSVERSRAKIVWVGLSTPKQELFAAELAKRVKGCFIITVGAAFDFHTGVLKQAPPWIQKSGLEWLFRLAIEPRRLIGRYVLIVPLFSWVASAELVRYYGLRLYRWFRSSISVRD